VLQLLLITGVLPFAIQVVPASLSAIATICWAGAISAAGARTHTLPPAVIRLGRALVIGLPIVVAVFAAGFVVTIVSGVTWAWAAGAIPGGVVWLMFPLWSLLLAVNTPGHVGTSISARRYFPDEQPADRDADGGRDADGDRGPLTTGGPRSPGVVAGIYLLGLAVVLQFLFAGLGIFFDYQFLTLWHATVGAIVIGVLSLLLVPIGRVGRVPGRTLWLTASVFGLVAVQSLLLFPFHMNATGLLRAVSALHVVNALLIAWVVLRLVQRASGLLSRGAVRT
jgi:hypothetical protein